MFIFVYDVIVLAVVVVKNPRNLPLKFRFTELIPNIEDSKKEKNRYVHKYVLYSSEN